MRQAPSVSSANGFTLLELLISLAISVAVAALVFSSLNVGVRAWERGEADSEGQQRARVVMDMIGHQIRSAFPDQELTDPEGKRFVMKGDGQSLSFISQVPMLPENFGHLVEVHYLVQEDESTGARSLFIFEEPVLFGQGSDTGDMAPDEEKEGQALFSDMEDIRFSYLVLGKDGPEWAEEWDGTKSKGFPVAVMVSMRQHEGQGGALPPIIARLEQRVR
jgi:prepilin-type N-terminal cleavage/methylation domain-containing protein